MRHGGKRKNAGRKVSEYGCAISKCVSLYKCQWDVIEKVAKNMNCNRSDALRHLLRTSCYAQSILSAEKEHIEMTER